MRRSVAVVQLLVLLGLDVTQQTSVAPDVTGLVGTPYFYDVPSAGPNAVRLPLKFWANSRDAALRPRKVDRSPHALMRLLGDDFDPRWMRRTRREDKLMAAQLLNASTLHVHYDNETRPSVNALWDAALALQPPAVWPAPPPGITHVSEHSRGVVPASWLVALATCPSRNEWRDLGVFFWPRFVRRVECERLVSKRKSAAVGCGWPPGRLSCAPGATRTLHLLRWHCRLRDATEDTWARLTAAMSPGKPAPLQPPPRRKRRERYRCEWLKVPYPVPADCQCGGV